MAVFENFTSTGETYENETCDPTVRKEYIGFAVVAVVEIILNVVIIIAVLRGRRMLRHNYVYAYVTSTLASNIAFGLGSSLNVLTNYLATENKRVNFTLSEDVTVMKWWAFRKSFTIAVFLIMSASVASLIYGIRESSYFIGRFSSQATLQETSSKRSSITTRKNKAILVILAAWLCPVIFSLTPVIFDTCLRNCRCHPALYIDNVCHTDVNKHCSATLVPAPKYFIIVVLVVWAALVLFNGFLLFSAISAFLKAVSPLPRSNSKDDEKDIKLGKKQLRQKRNCPGINHNIKLLLYMEISYVLFTLPAMIVLTIDILSYASILNFVGAATTFVLALVYTLVSPILLVTYMPGLRSAVLDMFSRIGRTATTSGRSTKETTENEPDILG